jgi:hypothetical protein
VLARQQVLMDAKCTQHPKISQTRINKSKEEKSSRLKNDKRMGVRELRFYPLPLYHGCSRPSQVQNRP